MQARIYRRCTLSLMCIYAMLCCLTGCTNPPATTVGTVSSHSATTVPNTSTGSDLMTEVFKSNLNTDMQSLFSGNTVVNETVMFLDKGTEKALMYKADQILTVTSYDGWVVYEKGVDYELRDGKLYIPETSSIPCITSKRYYNPGEPTPLMADHNGKAVYVYWGEGALITDWQIQVTYTHSDTWEGYVQESQKDVYKDFIRKLQSGEDVTIVFYGDSITFGASASFIYGYAPGRYSYPLLFTQALADLFGYTVRYIPTGLEGTSRIPAEDYVAGTRGTITYVNPAVGGWTTQDGLSHFDEYIKPIVGQYGCDLFVDAYGMNDPAVRPQSVRANTRVMLDELLEIAPNTAIMLVSTMLPNPTAIGGVNGNQYQHEEQFLLLAEAYQNNGIPCAVACVTSVNQSILEHKEYMDYTGNNLNHPNDYFCRVYAQVLLQTLYGYENMM